MARPGRSLLPLQLMVLGIALSCGDASIVSPPLQRGATSKIGVRHVPYAGKTSPGRTGLRDGGDDSRERERKEKKDRMPATWPTRMHRVPLLKCKTSR
jgi:hypothetical protein